MAQLITDEEFFDLKDKLNLSSRHKTSTEKSLFVLLDLQQAAAKWYFTTENVHSLLDTFTDEWELQARVIVCMFSRIYDLEHLDIILRYLKSEAQQKVINSLGYLNIINPLKIGFDYVINLRYLDNRMLLVMLMELASIESADNIIEEPTTEVAISTLYGSYTRALDVVRPEIMRFTYADFGVRTKHVSWGTRRDMLKKCLLGSKPLNPNTFEVIKLHKELEVANCLTMGPIDLQYSSYVKSVIKNAGNLRMRKTAHTNSDRVQSLVSASLALATLIES